MANCVGTLGQFDHCDLLRGEPNVCTKSPGPVTPRRPKPKPCTDVPGEAVMASLEDADGQAAAAETLGCHRYES